MTLRRFHRLNAIVLGAFILLHLFNHAFTPAGADAHINVMEALRRVYRFLPVEALIIVQFAMQILAGLLLAYRRGRPRGQWAWAQVASGGILAFFLLQHLGAVLFMRLTSDLDTNFYWAASVVSADPLRWYFIPYYWLGLTAIFVHIAAALRFRRIGGTALPFRICVAGGLFALLVVTSLSGGITAIELPDAYRTYLNEMYGV